MSGSKDKDKEKEEKKKAKEEIKEFKKAFKKQTGIESDNTDVNKVLPALQKQFDELKKWTAILIKLQPDARDVATQRLVTWNNHVTGCKDLAKTNAKAAGTRARDLLAVLLKVNEAVRKQAKSQPAKKQVGDREVSVYITDIPGFADLPANEREEALTVAANKIGQGLAIYDQLSNGTIDVDDPNHVTRPDQVEALVWAMKSKAQEKNRGPYQKGAMTVPNGVPLRKFLDKCPEVYSRLSSHLREEQGRNKSGGVRPQDLEGQTPRGMDFYNIGGDDKPGQLPAGMNALLFQQVKLPGGEIALYMKMESEGSYGHPGDNRKMDPSVPPDRPKHPNDGARARKHLKNLLIKAKGDDKDLPGLREQTPKEVVEAIKDVVSAVEGGKAKAYLKSSYGTEPKAIIFKKLVPRISLFLDAFEKAHAHDGEKGWEIGDKAEDLFDRLNQILISIIPADLLESDRRMGGEVVVTESDLANIQDDTGGTDDDGSESDDDSNELDILDEDEYGDDLHNLRMECVSLVDLVRDPELKQRLETIVHEQILEGTDDAFSNFSKAIEKSDVDRLGPAASKLADKLLPHLDRV